MVIKFDFICFIFEKKWNREKLYPLIPVLLLLDLVFGKYSLLLFGYSIPYIFVRNFFCVGLPYFLIGDMLNVQKIRMKPRNTILLSMLFATTTLVERFILGYFNVNASRDHYVSTTLLAIFVFLFAVQFESKSNNKLHNGLCYVGANLSTSIYILHPILITVVEKSIKYLSKYIPIYGVYSYIAPFIIMLITAMVSWIYYIAVKKAKSKLVSR